MADSLDMSYPFTGRWEVRNSPANRVPSHGTALFGLSYAIDFVPVDATGRSAAFTPKSFFQVEPPTAFTGFGRTIGAPIDGVVVATHAAEPDHDAYRGLPSVRYALTQRQRLRRGWVNIVGNHVLIETHTASGTRTMVALCHLQQDSILVQKGQRVRRGDKIARCGNSGNSTEPHLHLHALDGSDLMHSNAVPITFNGSLPRNKTVVSV
jgi:hypothetical protein